MSKDQDKEDFDLLAIRVIDKIATKEQINTLNALVASDDNLAVRFDKLKSGNEFIKSITEPDLNSPKLSQSEITKLAKQCIEILQQKETPPAFHTYFVVDLAGDAKMLGNLQKAFEGLGDTLNTADVYQFGKFSLITYNGDAQIAVPSCKPRMFQVPDLVPHAGDTRSLGSAYHLLAEQRQREVRSDDYGAMVFTLLNGSPTDDWEQPANRVKELFGQNSIMIDQSGEVDSRLLNKATEYRDIFGIKGTEPKDYQNLIKEIGSCVEQTSTQYSKIGHSIQAEHQGTSAPLGPTLSLSWDILTSLAS